ncbi:MAG: hypothetical protein HY334_04315, partial [Armatimonadetes bacterium]|nr:hypothetical protein [Armatimonadota bacterium]
MIRLLSVSNGHGEDLIAAEILRHLDDLEVTAFPLVGLGDAYPAALPRLEPRRAFPSGGFAFRHGQPSLLDDLRAGFIRFWFAQRATLRAQQGRVDLTLAVGDVYCLFMASRAGAPVVLVASADSIHNGPYGPLQLRVMRRAVRVFARDADTAAWLAARGIPAAYLGNVMLDCLRPAGAGDFDLPAGRPVVTLLPGSRSDAPHNAALLAEVAARVARARPEAVFLLSLAQTVDAEEVAGALRDAGVRVANGEAVLEEARLRLTRAFAAAIARATVVVGLAGTANEQAAGLGKPVVAFPGPGVQFTPGFLSLQRKILGEALVPTPSAEEAAGAVLRLLASPEERARRGQAGRERMGEPGAGARIAAALRAIVADLPTA